MTPLNTIIEEEVDAYKNDYAQAITDVGGFGLAKHLERFLTTAMQRAYEAGREERDTYWKEMVRKETLQELLKEYHCNEIEGKGYDFYFSIRTKLNTLLDNLK